MTNLRLISRFLALSSVLAAAVFAFRERAAPSAVPRVGETPSWPPPDGVYWGM
jgi:hypothetical protein